MGILSGLISENVDRHTQDIVTLTATASITTADHSGRTLLMGEVGGDAAATFTLPAATGTGSVFKFVVSVVNTSNYLIKVADATDTIDGQIVITVGSSAAQTNVSSYNVATMHLNGEAYVNFSSSSTAAISTANDIKLAAGLHSLTVPKQVGNNQYLNYARVGGTDVTMRLVLS